MKVTLEHLPDDIRRWMKAAGLSRAAVNMTSFWPDIDATLAFAWLNDFSVRFTEKEGRVIAWFSNQVPTSSVVSHVMVRHPVHRTIALEMTHALLMEDFPTYGRAHTDTRDMVLHQQVFIFDPQSYKGDSCKKVQVEVCMN